MLDKTQIKARELVIEQIDKIVEKYSKKAEKEKSKKNNAFVVYQGEKYFKESELQEAYACDCFSSSIYDKLLDKLDKARGNIDVYAMTPSETLVMELVSIKSNFSMELRTNEIEKKHKEHVESRMKELTSQGYSYREAETIIGNEELMRFE